MKLFIADDHPIVRSGLSYLLRSAFPSAEISEFENGEHVVQTCQSQLPDLLIVDIEMPHKSGLDICKELTDSGCPTRIIILTMYKDIEMQKLAFFNGAKGYLVKDNTSEELVDAIAAVLDGKTFLSRGLIDHQLPEESTPQQMKVAEHLSNLTRTELKTLKLVSQKRSSKEIADLLFVSAKSVENYRSRICKKLHLDARNNSLLLWVLENKSVIDRLI